MEKRNVIALGVLGGLVVVAGVMAVVRRPAAVHVVTAETRPEETVYVVSPVSGKRHAMSEFKPMAGSTTMVVCPDTGKPVLRSKLLSQVPTGK